MQNTKLPSLILILILTVTTSVVWASLSVYRAFAVKPSPAVPEEISKALTATLNQNTLSEIERKLFFNDNEIPQLNLIQSVQVLPTATPEIAPTPAATESATPVATSSAAPTGP